MADGNVGSFTLVLVAGIDGANDRLYFWNDSETDEARSQAITPNELSAWLRQNIGPLLVTEQANADADIAGKGQFWVVNSTPNRAKFTNDAGTDFEVQLETVIIPFTGETEDLAVGTGVREFQLPFGMELLGIGVSLTTAPVGSIATFDFNENGSTILSTKITIDAGEKNSNTAVTPPVLSSTTLAAWTPKTVDIDGVGATTAGAGGKLILFGYRTSDPS